MARLGSLALGVLMLAGCPNTPAWQASGSEFCIASVYWEGFGRPLADGRRHRSDEILAAHRTLALGSSVRITVLATGRTLIVRIFDRGPYVRGRCIDLSRGAARSLQIDGLTWVRIDPVPQSSGVDAIQSGTDVRP